MSDIILHNYPQSPVAEKVRAAFGIKGLAWNDVEIPRIVPKPMLTKLTGGYRRTPVMQIGADIYCDSQCIIDELEARFPEPTFRPAENAGLLRTMGRWTDGALFDLAVKLVLGASADVLPKDFAEDRGRLYFGAEWQDDLKAAQASLNHLSAQMRTLMQWLNDQLADGRKFVAGDNPSAIDAQYYHVIWFLRGRWTDGPDFLSAFPHIERWEKSVATIGHGSPSPMTPEAAIERATQSQPQAVKHNDTNDPQGLKPGMSIVVSPDVDGGEQPVEGEVIAASVERVTIKRSDADAGTLHVHFPRMGYRVDITD